MARGNGPFRVLARVGANAYKLEIHKDMVVLAAFNGCDLSSYVEDEIEYGDLRENPFKEGRVMQIKAQLKTIS